MTYSHLRGGATGGKKPALEPSAEHAQQPAVRGRRSPSAHTECGIGYSCHSTGWPSATRTSRDWRARAIGITGSLRAVGQEDRRVAVGGVPLGLGLRGQRQVARQADQPGEPLVVAQAGHERHRAALAEAGQDDARGRRRRAPSRCAISASTSACDSRSPASSSRCWSRVEAEDVVPGAHHVAAVDRHRPRRRVREDEAHRADGGRGRARGRPARSRCRRRRGRAG